MGVETNFSDQLRTKLINLSFLALNSNSIKFEPIGSILIKQYQLFGTAAANQGLSYFGLSKNCRLDHPCYRGPLQPLNIVAHL